MNNGIRRIGRRPLEKKRHGGVGDIFDTFAHAPEPSKIGVEKISWETGVSASRLLQIAEMMVFASNQPVKVGLTQEGRSGYPALVFDNPGTDGVFTIAPNLHPFDREESEE